MAEADRAEAIAERLLEFIRAASPLPDQEPNTPQRQVYPAPRTGRRSMAYMVRNYENCLRRLTHEQRLALDQVIRALSGAIGS
jgi:hypothetical protein